MSCGTMRAGRAVEATNSGSLREPNSNARRGRQKDSGARLFARRKSPSRSTATPREPSRRRPAREVEFSRRNRDHDLPPHDLPFHMGIGVVLASSVVAVARNRLVRRKPFEPVVVIGVQPKAEGILRSIATGLSNGVLEAINGNVQAAKRKAKGYRTKRNLKAVVYLIAGDVLANSPT